MFEQLSGLPIWATMHKFVYNRVQISACKAVFLFYILSFKNLTMENDYEKDHQHVEEPYNHGTKEGNTYTDDMEGGLEMPERTLQRQLKNRHIAMISIGGVIGMYCHLVTY